MLEVDPCEGSVAARESEVALQVEKGTVFRVIRNLRKGWPRQANPGEGLVAAREPEVALQVEKGIVFRVIRNLRKGWPRVACPIGTLGVYYGR